MVPLRLPDGELDVLCLGAHCDDIEIGCGGALLELIRARPDARVHWVVFSGDARRADETRSAARQIGGHSIDVDVCDFRNGYFPYIGSQIKDYFEALKARMHPTLIFSHWLSDRHQDHRTIAELTWNTFRDHSILEYEIAKFEGDLGHPSTFVPVSSETARRKISILRDAFISQRDKQWFSDDTFRAMLRLRGIECNAPSGFAEAFHSRKVALAFD